MQELGDMTHRVEHFKYMASHATMLLKKQRKIVGGPMDMP